MMVTFEWQECMVLLDEDWDFKLSLHVHKDGGEHVRMNLHIGMLV